MTRPFGPLPEQRRHEWIYLEPAKWGPGARWGNHTQSVAYFRCMRCHIKRVRKIGTDDKPDDVCHMVPYTDRNRAAARERQRRLREAGICTSCGVEDAAPTLTRCASCAQGHNEYTRVTKSNER